MRTGPELRDVFWSWSGPRHRTFLVLVEEINQVRIFSAHDEIAKKSSILIGEKAKNDKNYELLLQHLRSEMRRKNQILNRINSFFTHSV